MTTVLQYLVIAAVIGLLLFGLALLLFGRGERLSALPARTSPAQLPERGIDGADVRRVRFALALRGYRMSDVDWTLDRLADELDRTRDQLHRLTGEPDRAVGSAPITGAQPDLYGATAAAAPPLVADPPLDAPPPTAVDQTVDADATGTDQRNPTPPDGHPARTAAERSET